MITEEQIKNLNPGDPLIIHGTFNEICKDGDIAFEVKETLFDGEAEEYITYCHPSCVSLPSEPPTLVGSHPKYDPCRKFRKGDRVRVIPWNGRSPFDTNHCLKINPGEVHIVLDDEYERNEVYIGMSAADEEQSVIHSCHLELITPVEELERYVIIHNERERYYDVCWKDDDEPDGRTGRTRVRATFWYHKPPQTYSQTEALSAAETECARLNAEHRKEQQ